MNGKFKTELHCHTGDVSVCGQCSAEYIVSRYVDAGYNTLVVTDHFNRHTFSLSNKYLGFLQKNNLDASWEGMIDFFLSGYRHIKEVAGDRLNVLLGMEFMPWVSCSKNDFLLFGVTEEWLKASPFLPRLTYSELAIYAHACGLKIYQAHPFRVDAMISDPRYLDGIEVYNGTVNVNSNNCIADFWAGRHGLKKISGTDFHETIHQTVGGILTDAPITTNQQLLEVLDSQDNYTLVKDLESIG